MTYSKFITQTENKNFTTWCDIATHLWYLSQLSTHSSGMLSSSLWTAARRGHLPAGHNDIFWFWVCTYLEVHCRQAREQALTLLVLSAFCFAQGFCHCLIKAAPFSDARFFHCFSVFLLTHCYHIISLPDSLPGWFLSSHGLPHVWSADPGGTSPVGSTIPAPTP